MAAISTEPENLRCVVVVDDDINVFNEPEVTWAVGTRMRPDKDVLTIPDWNGPGDLLPSNWNYTLDGTHEPVMGAVMILDATKPAPPGAIPGAGAAAPGQGARGAAGGAAAGLRPLAAQ